MEPKAVVKYKGALAHYNVSPGNEGIYQAQLIRYDGKPDQVPPKQITLVRGLDHWSGSSDKQDLIDKIGEVIERRIKHYDPLFSKKNNDPTPGMVNPDKY